MKKIFIISLVLFFITLFFLGVYNFAFRKSVPAKAPGSVSQSEPAQGATSKSEQSTTLPKKDVSKIMALSKSPVLAYAINKQNETISFYSSVDGTVWQSDLDGKSLVQTVISKLEGLQGVEWSPDATKVLTQFNKNGSNVWYVYDYKTKTGIQLKDGIDFAVWDGIGSKIIYKYYDVKTKTRSLNIMDQDGKNWKKLADIPFKKIGMTMVPLASNVAFWNWPDANEQTQLQTVGVSGDAPKTLFSGRFGADYQWSPDGTKALVSSVQDKSGSKLSLGLVSADGSYADLGIPTFVSKCAWSADSKTVYYALPGGIPDGSVLPNDYQDKKFLTADTFWKIDIATGKKDRVIDPGEISGNFDSSSLKLSPTENALFFINRADGRLYRIGL